MIKKMLVASGAVFLLSTFTVGLPLWSYARCGLDWLSTSANEVLPLEWEIKRARQMIADLRPEIDQNAREIAREKVEVARLEKQFKDAKTGLDKSRDQIERLTLDLKAGDTQYTYAGIHYTSAQVKSDLEGRFKRHKTKSETVKKLSQILDARRLSLKSTQSRMSSMMDVKRQLEVEVENLEARLGALRVAETTTGLSLDDSQLQRTRDLLDDIAIRLDVHEESITIETEYFDQIDLSETAEQDLLDEVAEYLELSSEQSDAESLVAIQLD